jgi:hypothetical protein
MSDHAHRIMAMMHSSRPMSQAHIDYRLDAIGHVVA